MGYDLCEETNMTPSEYAMGGVQWRTTPNNLTRLVRAKRTEIMRGGVHEGWRRWLDAASTDGSPGASDWVTAIPASPETTMSNTDFALCCKASFRLSQVTLGYPCTYIENSNGHVRGEPHRYRCLACQRLRAHPHQREA